MAQQPPLMPKATAVWLVDHTALSFEQIADFVTCTSSRSAASPTVTSRAASWVRTRPRTGS